VKVKKDLNKSRSNIQERAGTEDARAAAAAEKEEEEEAEAGAGAGEKRGGEQEKEMEDVQIKENFKPRTFLNGFWAVQRRFLQDPRPPMLGTPTMIQEMPRGEEK